uniref:Putative tick transposon n=1 Tax=Ixodes ricinus TaxID=34613 RepID=A0A131Y531_IXORI
MLFPNLLYFYNTIFFDHQHGFRRGFSRETQLSLFTHEIHANFESHHRTDAIFLYFSKAFDRVPHLRLLTKLSALKINDSVISWIHNFLSSRVQFSVVNSHESGLCNVTSGVPQGSALGLLLFLIFNNDLPHSISSKVCLFADDCVLYRPIASPDNHVLLQNDLSTIMNWCSDWQMSLSYSKCKLVCFTRKRSVSSCMYFLGTQPIEEVQSYKYLGVLVTSDLSWAAHIEFISLAASKTLGYIRRCLHSAPPNLRLLAYQTFVRPRLEYAAAIWSPHQIYLTTQLEAIQNRAARYILSVYDHTASVTALESQLNVTSLATRRKCSRLCLFHKILHHHPDIRSMLLQPPPRSSRRLTNSNCMQRISGSTNAFNNSFFPLAISEWNVLPECIALIICPDAFRSSLVLHFQGE